MNRRPSPFETAHDKLRAIGIRLTSEPGGYGVNFQHARSAATAYFTDELQDALERGRAMAEHRPPPSEPPLGPTGRRRSRRAMMYAHNAKIAARRRRRARSE